jgi:rare lipoprotein A (peptidoglycan hydrolase)
MEAPSYYQEGNMIYSVGVEREPENRNVRMSYRPTPAAVRRADLRRGALENARRVRENETIYVSSSTPRKIRYRNPTYPAASRRRSTGLRIPGRSETTTGYAAPRRSVRRMRASGTTHAVASWYGWEFHGRKTANGETYNMYDHTAAHKTLPFGTIVRVTNLRTGRQKVVRINDRGPFIAGRDIDLSYATARDLGMLESGVEDVRLEILPG